ncbi:hypothetical protein, partial [Microcoleus sp. F4-D5]|uniref:hypothetical protein n=1 Tax=Microcoleus sp. F4-D5 TaxID=2818760 RepID=UPI002FD009D9
YLLSRMIHFYPLHLPMCQLGVRNVGRRGCGTIAILARIICEFLTPSPMPWGGLGWGKNFTTPAIIAIYKTIIELGYLGNFSR